jgi:hypothetical protein
LYTFADATMLWCNIASSNGLPFQEILLFITNYIAHEKKHHII